MRVLFIVLFITGGVMACSGGKIVPRDIDYDEDRKLLVELLKETILTGPSTIKFSNFVTNIDEKYRDLYLIKNFRSSYEDCTFWYGYHQIIGSTLASGRHESWPFVLSIVNGERVIPIGSYCLPPLIEPEPVPKNKE